MADGEIVSWRRRWPGEAMSVFLLKANRPDPYLGEAAVLAGKSPADYAREWKEAMNTMPGVPDDSEEESAA